MIINLNKLKHSDKAIEYMNRKRTDGRTGWDFGHHSDIRNDKSSAVVANFFKGVPYNVFKDWDVIRKFHPIECERLQTLPDNYTEGVSNTQRYKMIGNGWTIDVISHIFGSMLLNHLKNFLLPPSECLSTHGGAGYASGSYFDGDDIICGWCGTRIKNPEPTGGGNGIVRYGELEKKGEYYD